MALGGITTVGEFHYLHHGPDGTPYDDPNAMGRALLEAGEEAGVRVVLLDTCYLAAGIGREPEGVQRRFSDGSAEAWAARVDDLHREVTSRATHRQEGWGGGLSAVGAAMHSVRAVPRDQVPVVARWATSHQAPLHVHLSEQVAENDECRAAHGMTPTELLDDAGALGPQTSAVHATHLTDSDVALLGGSATAACFCPTTERDLGDGIGPSRALFEAGSPLTLGSDSHAVIDLFEEMRAVELDERLATQERGHWTAAELLAAATADGHRSLGLPDAGRIAVGARADLVTLDLGEPAHGGNRCRRGNCGVRRERRRRRARGARRGGGRHRRRPLRRGCRAGPRDQEGVGTVTTLLLTGIGELTTHDPAHGSGRAARRRARRRVGPRRVDRPGRERARRPTRRTTWAGGR